MAHLQLDTSELRQIVTSPFLIRVEFAYSDQKTKAMCNKTNQSPLNYQIPDTTERVTQYY